MEQTPRPSPPRIPSKRSAQGGSDKRSGPRRLQRPVRSGPARGAAAALARYERTRTSLMVGSAVRAARRSAEISQAELARRAGTSQPSIARLEQGRVSPTIISLERIAKALGSELVVDFEPISPQGER